MEESRSRREILGIGGSKTADAVMIPLWERLTLAGLILLAACGPKSRGSSPQVTTSGGGGGGGGGTGTTVPAGTTVLALTQMKAFASTSSHPQWGTGVSSVNGVSDGGGATGGLVYSVDGGQPGTNAAGHALTAGTHTVTWSVARTGQTIVTIPVTVT